MLISDASPTRRTNASKALMILTSDEIADPNQVGMILTETEAFYGRINIQFLIEVKFRRGNRERCR